MDELYRHTEQEETRNSRLVESMIKTCDQLSDEIYTITTERDEMQATLDLAKYIDLDLKASILDGYAFKIDNLTQELKDVKDNLNNYGYEYAS